MESGRNEILRSGRGGRVARMLRMQRHELAERLAETRKIFARKVRAVDIHSHTVFSDGEGTVQENYDAAMERGLDFMFATDHNSLMQKRKTKGLPNASWGQEPPAGAHHMACFHRSGNIGYPSTKFAYRSED